MCVCVSVCVYLCVCVCVCVSIESIKTGTHRAEQTRRVVSPWRAVVGRDVQMRTSRNVDSVSGRLPAELFCCFSLSLSFSSLTTGDEMSPRESTSVILFSRDRRRQRCGLQERGAVWTLCHGTLTLCDVYVERADFRWLVLFRLH